MSRLRFVRDFVPHMHGTLLRVACLDGEREVARLERVLSREHMMTFNGNPLSELDAMEDELRKSEPVMEAW